MPNPLLVATNLYRLVVRRASKWNRHWLHQMRRGAKGVGDAAKAGRAITGRTVKAGHDAVSVARWSSLARLGVQASALLKLSANGRTRRDRFALSSLENHVVRQSAGMLRPVWISPHLLHRSARQITPANVVTFANLSQLVRPVSEEPTIEFIDEIIRQRRPFNETTLFRDVQSGKVRWKRLGAETVMLTTANFHQYYEKCCRQVELVANLGLRPWDKSTASGYDSDIAVLLTVSGELVFLRRGTHRLGIARALGLERIPVQIFMVAGMALADSADDAGWYLPWRLSAALRRACGTFHAAVEREREESLGCAEARQGPKRV